jgi:hypothetical protein
MADNEFRLVEHDLQRYPCGLRVGDTVRLRTDIVVRDYHGTPTGRAHRAGEIWSIDVGVSSEPEVIWLIQADGDRHTWNYDESFHETFEILPREQV